MKNKNKVILWLLILAVALFLLIAFVIVPAIKNEQDKYAANQTDALTHDITAIKDFKSLNMGDAPNIGNMFYALPLNNISMKFQLNSEAGTLTVNYLDTVWNIGEEKVKRDLIYNTVAAMATIDNLNEITYEFSGSSYSFSREQVKAIFDMPLSELLTDSGVWKEKVQEQLKSIDFVEKFFSIPDDNNAAMNVAQTYLDAFVGNAYAAKFTVYTGSPVDMENADFQETVVLGNNVYNYMETANGDRIRVLVRGNEQTIYMIDDEKKQYSTRSADSGMFLQYEDFNFVQSGTENLNQTDCLFYTYAGEQIANGSETSISITIYLRADSQAIYAIKTERDTSTEIILIKEMRTSVTADEVECPNDYEKVEALDLG